MSVPPTQISDEPPPASTLLSHHKPGGGFVNPWPSWAEHGTFSFLGLLFKDWNYRRGRVPPPEKRVPVIAPDWKTIRESANGISDPAEIHLTWLGHATFLVQMDGVNILTDPIFSRRCSSVQFVGPARYTDPPCQLEELPSIDVVVISHNHYDHLDRNTVIGLGNRPHYYVPLGNKAWFEAEGITNVTECDWWDEHVFTKAAQMPGRQDTKIKIACTPSQHFTGRSLTDRFKTLWSSWVLQSEQTSGIVYFAGDTGYRSVPKGTDEDMVPVCPAFRDIGEKYGPFDAACIPIGAYSPRWFMSPVHCSPEDAVCVHLAVRSRLSIGMHWGTFVLTDEDQTEPPIRVRREMERRGLDPASFQTCKIGETVLARIQRKEEVEGFIRTS